MDLLNKRVELDVEYQKLVAGYSNDALPHATYITYHETHISPIRIQIDSLTHEIEQPSFVGCPGCGQAFRYLIYTAYNTSLKNPQIVMLTLRHKPQTTAEAPACKLLGFGAKYRENVILRHNTTITRASFPKYREELPVD